MFHPFSAFIPARWDGYPVGLVPGEGGGPAAAVALRPHRNNGGRRPAHFHIQTRTDEGHAPLLCAGKHMLVMPTRANMNS